MLLHVYSLPALCNETGVFAVISATVSSDNRPALWLNYEGAGQNIALCNFRGPRYDFTGVIQNKDTTSVITGLNTAGFALVYTTNAGNNNTDTRAHPCFIKKSLGTCASIADFEELIITHQGGINIGCVDANGDCAFYELCSHKIIKYNMNDSSDVPNGWLVRENFSFTCEESAAGSAWRYHRVNELLKQARNEHILDYKYLLQNVARDLHPEELNPYPLPFTGSFRDAPTGHIKTTTTINRHNTTVSVVIQGINKIFKSLPAVLWIIPGEPVAGIAVPVWPSSGTIPKELSGKSISNMNQEVQENERKIYHTKNHPEYLDSKVLAGGNNAMLTLFLKQENEIFRQTTAFQKTFANNPHNYRELEKFQNTILYQAIKLVR